MRTSVLSPGPIRAAAVPMPRIVLVGAGSVEFTRNLLGDILTSPALRASDIALHDIDPERLATAERMARWTASALGAAPTISAHLDRREALEGADFVVNTIQVGGARATQLDFDVPARSGCATRSPTRSASVACSAACGRSRSCSGSPATWRRSSPTPGSSTTRTRSRSSSGRCPRPRASASSGCATRSSGRSTGWPATSACRATRSIRPAPGSTTSPSSSASSITAATSTRTCAPSSRPAGPGRRSRPGGPLPAFGVYPTESSEHHAEYNPWFIGKRDAAGDAVERFHIPIGEYLDRVAHNLDEYAETRRMLDAGETVRDRAERRVRGHDRRGDDDRRAGPDRRQRDEPRGADPEPRRDACVEVPGLVDGLGVHPVAMGPLPLQLAAYMRGAVDMQGLTVRAALDHDRAADRPRGHDRPARPEPPDPRRRLAPDRRDDRSRGGVAARVARRFRSRLKEEHPMSTDRTGSGGAMAAPRRPDRRRGDRRLGLWRLDRDAVPRPGAQRERGRRAASPSAASAPPSAAPSDAGYTGPGRDDHLLDLGRPGRDQEPAGGRRRVPRREPEDHRQGHRVRLGAPTGTSSRPRSPAAMRPTSSRWTARSSRTTRPATSCST